MFWARDLVTLVIPLEDEEDETNVEINLKNRTTNTTAKLKLPTQLFHITVYCHETSKLLFKIVNYT